jgi:GAF domain-containing protein
LLQRRETPKKGDCQVQSASIPENEAARLETLRQYQILDTDSEDSFDDLARLASYVCDTPTAVISLIDGSRQWFKARVGVRARETGRDISFCAHAILGERCFIVEDALADERFADNPLVTGEPFIRFYAGMPLISPEGFAIGTLCVMDRKSRTLTKEQIRGLEMLANQVMSQLELRREVRFLERAVERHKHAEAQLRKAVS